MQFSKSTAEASVVIASLLASKRCSASGHCFGAGPTPSTWRCQMIAWSVLSRVAAFATSCAKARTAGSKAGSVMFSNKRQ